MIQLLLRIPQKNVATSLLVAVCVSSSGCYKYVSSTTPPRVGSHVELMLKEDAQEKFRNRGVNFVEYFVTGAGAFDGIVLENTADSLLVRIASVRIENYRERTLYQHVALAHTDIDQVKQRRINSAASGVLLGIGAVIVGYSLLKVIGGSPECPAPLQADCQ